MLFSAAEMELSSETDTLINIQIREQVSALKKKIKTAGQKLL